MQSLEGGRKPEPLLSTEKASATEAPCVREYRLNGSVLRDVIVQGKWLTVSVLPLRN
jgi:hypothetical protein